MQPTRTTLLLALIIGVSLSAPHVLAAPASFSAAQSLNSTTSAPGNLYVGGTTVVLTAPVAGDFTALGGSIVTAAPISGDELLLGGSITSRARVNGDFRAIAGSITISEPVNGDVVAFGLSVYDTARAGGSVFIVAANTTLAGGAAGPVTVYGNNIALSGDFAGDVQVTAGSRLSVAPNTTIHGKLSYEAPEMTKIPDSAVIDGGVAYTNASYLPDPGTSRILSLISIGFFLIIRIIGTLILAGLLAGLFPKFAEMLVGRIFAERRRDLLLALLLGFAVIVAAPIVIALLLLTFVGIGLGLLLGILYALLALLALLYAGITLGGLIVRYGMKRESIVWHDGVLGVLILSFVTLIPFAGIPIVFLLSCLSAGMLLQAFFRFAFLREENI